MYAYVRTDNMSGTSVAKDIASAKFYDKETEAAIENGNIVTIGEYLSNEREVRKASTPVVGTPLRDLYLVATPEVIKDKNYYGLGEYINKAGTTIRCYRLTSGSIYSVTKEALEGAAKVGSIVEAQAKTKAKIVTTPTASATKIGTVVALEGEYIVIEVA